MVEEAGPARMVHLEQGLAEAAYFRRLVGEAAAGSK